MSWWQSFASYLLSDGWRWGGLIVAFVLAIALSFLFTAVGLWIGKLLASKTRSDWDDRLLELMRGPTRLFLAVAIAWPLIGWLRLPQSAIDHVLRVAMIAAIA